MRPKRPVPQALVSTANHDRPRLLLAPRFCRAHGGNATEQLLLCGLSPALPSFASIAADHSAAAKLQSADSGVLQPTRLLHGVLAQAALQGPVAPGLDAVLADEALSVAAEGWWEGAQFVAAPGGVGGAGTALAPAALSAVAVGESELSVLPLVSAGFLASVCSRDHLMHFAHPTLTAPNEPCHL